MPSVRNVHSRLAALEARLPASAVDADAPTPAQCAELARRVAAIKATTGDDLLPILERYALAENAAAKEVVTRACTLRELYLFVVVRGDALDDDGRFTRGRFTDEERAAIAAACTGWGQL